MGTSKWFFSMSGVILLIGALAIAGKGLNFGIDFESGTRITTALQKPASVEDVRNALERRTGYGDAKIQTVNNTELGKQRLPDLDARRSSPRRSTTVNDALDQALRRRAATSRRRVDRPDVRQERSRNSAIIAIIASLLRDLDLHRAALRVEVRRAGADRADARHPDHGGRLRPHRPGGDDVDGRGAAHHPRLTRSTTRSSCSTASARTCRACRARRSRRSSTARCPRCSPGRWRRASAPLLPVLALLLFGGETLKDFAFALLVGIASRAPTRRSSSPRRCSRTGRSASRSIARRERRDPRRTLGVRAGVRDARSAARRSTSRRAEQRRGASRAHRAGRPDAGLAGGVRRRWSRDLGVAQERSASRGARAAAAAPAGGRAGARPTAAAPAPPAGRAGGDGREAGRARRRAATRSPRSRATARTGGRADGHARLGR